MKKMMTGQFWLRMLLVAFISGVIFWFVGIIANMIGQSSETFGQAIIFVASAVFVLYAAQIRTGKEELPETIATVLIIMGLFAFIKGLAIFPALNFVFENTLLGFGLAFGSSWLGEALSKKVM